LASPADRLQAAKTLVRREVLRQVYAPRRVLAARLMLYYIPHYKEFDRPWISVRNAINELSGRGAIVAEKVGRAEWYHLPRVKPEKLQWARETKPPVYNAWSDALNRGGGRQAEMLWRAAFEAEGWVVPNKGVQVRCPTRPRPSTTSATRLMCSPPWVGRTQSLASEERTGRGLGRP
jgi:hypothetical protein